MSGGDDIVSDARLMQYLHGELSDAERAYVDAQLARSAAAAERLRVLRHRTTRLSTLLGAADPVPADVQASAGEIRPIVDRTVVTHVNWWRRTPPALRAAATIALLLGGVLLVEPVRAWVLDQARAVAEAVGLLDTEPADASPAAPASSTPAAGVDVRYSFPWSASTFEITTGSAIGTLVITTGRAGQVTAATTGTAGSFLTMPEGIRIEGEGATDAVYTITLPPDVRTLRLNHGGRTIEHTVPAGGSGLRLPLR
jgi:hypothetical protein